MIRSLTMIQVLLSVTVIVSAFSGPSSAATEAAPSFKKIFTIILENTSSPKAHAQPFLKDFAARGADLTNMLAEAHPSQGNYVALTSGDLNGVTSDKNYDLDVNHIGDLLDGKGLNWKVYAESYPGNCFRGAATGHYARKHVPFISYLNVQRNPDRCRRIVDASELDRDIQNGTLPDYALFIPDLLNDGHDTGVLYADKYLAKKFGPLLQDARFMNEMLVVITFDESAGGQTNSIYTALFGSSVRPGSILTGDYNHYSLLRLVEDRWALGSLGRKDTNATAIVGIWK